MKHRVIFFIVPTCSDNQWLNDKMMQVTESFVSVVNSHDNYPIKIINKFTDLNRYLDQADFLVVMRAGNVILNPSIFLKKLKAIPESIGLIGHILKEDYQTPYLHDQMLVIRTAAFKTLIFNSSNDAGFEMVRSSEDMHNGNAPLYVEFTSNMKKRNHKFGTRLLIDCLSNGYRVRNFDLEWRWNLDSNSNIVSLARVNSHLDFILDYFPVKGYCYPEKSTNLFAQALKNLTIYSDLDSAQKIFIAIIKELLEFNVLNVWEFEQSHAVPNADTVICPAFGFFGETLAIKSGAKKLLFYDKNKNNINFKKDLYNYWNGIDYNAFVNQWIQGKNLKLEPIFDVDKPCKDYAQLQAEENIFPIWSTWKNSLEIQFKHCDLILDFDNILLEKENTTLLHTSTILNVYPLSSILYDRSTIEQVKNKIKSSGIIWSR